MNEDYNQTTMNRRSVILFASLLFLLLGSWDAVGQSQSADDIFMTAYKNVKYQGQDRAAKTHMELRNGSGKVIMERDLLVLRKNVEGSLEQKWYAYFNRPADLRKMVFLAQKNTEDDDDRWIYLPSMDLVKRLAGSDKRSSFAGSQFVYEDITGCLLYTSPSPRDATLTRMPSSA